MLHIWHLKILGNGRGGSCACADGRKMVNLVNGTSGRVARALYLDDAPRDFGPEVTFSLNVLSLQIPGLSDRQEGEKCRPLDHV